MKAGGGLAAPLQELRYGHAEQPVDLEVVVTGLAVAGMRVGQGAVEVHGDVFELLLAGDGIEAVLQFGGADRQEVQVLAGQVGHRRLGVDRVDEVRHDHRPAEFLGDGTGAVHEALVEAPVVGVAGAGDADPDLSVAVDVRLAGHERAFHPIVGGVVHRLLGSRGGGLGSLTGGFGRGAGLVGLRLRGGRFAARLIGCGLCVLQGRLGGGDGVLVAFGGGLGQIGGGVGGLGCGRRRRGRGSGGLCVAGRVPGVRLGALSLRHRLGGGVGGGAVSRARRGHEGGGQRQSHESAESVHPDHVFPPGRVAYLCAPSDRRVPLRTVAQRCHSIPSTHLTVQRPPGTLVDPAARRPTTAQSRGMAS